MKEFWLCFVPLFVAVDPIGVLPMYVGLVQDVPPQDLPRLIIKSIATATAVSLLFLFGGVPLLAALGVTVADFMIAGGALLFVISLSDLLQSGKSQRSVDPSSIGAVPLGVPLVAGPALLTTLLLVSSEYGLMLTTAAFLSIMLITGLTFWLGRLLLHHLGTSGAKIVSKVASLLLASIAVMLVRKGVLQIVADAMR